MLNFLLFSSVAGAGFIVGYIVGVFEARRWAIAAIGKMK